MLRYKLRTLLVLLALLPPLLWIGWTKYQAWRAAEETRRAIAEEIDKQNAELLRLERLMQSQAVPFSPVMAEAIQVEHAAKQAQLRLLEHTLQKLEKAGK